MVAGSIWAPSRTYSTADAPGPPGLTTRDPMRSLGSAAGRRASARLMVGLCGLLVSGTGRCAHWKPSPQEVQCSVAGGDVAAPAALSPAELTATATTLRSAKARRHST